VSLKDGLAIIGVVVGFLLVAFGIAGLVVWGGISIFNSAGASCRDRGGVPTIVGCLKPDAFVK
jgi:hypothetical protein